MENALQVATQWITDHMGLASGIGYAIVELVGRLWPSNKIRSPLSYLGRMLKAVGNLVFAVSDLISKVIPDRPAPPK